MCISSGPAKFFGTKILLNRMELEGVGEVMVLMYQNSVKSLDGKANAMLLHIPTTTDMSPENFIDMTDAPKVLDDMVEALTLRSRGAVGLGGSSKGLGSVQVFDSGVYTVILADNATDIELALNSVPVEKRPTISSELLAFYQSKFGVGYKFALACFNNSEVKEPPPIAFYYVPAGSEENYFTFPAIDCHTGEAPDLNAWVDVDHWLFASDSRSRMRGGSEIWYNKNIPRSIRKFLPDQVVGRRYSGMMPNGDFRYDLDQVVSSHLYSESRVTP